ncbi:MAG TPA: bifunctional [glutamine synthetase] adenylyltransferase/[glutamine synthetase]-adenylyl-L-tyrosine phosphorylase [Streptosporangiaceae bacterium]|nr:bifunctional [glutamine synthetase] adenylyltransferase/[glutamine synthetase]-adenylyl-L-tyrosine phosphorylase [Streptosporangiaceae bacterium]
MTIERATTLAGRLAAMGFADTASAQRLLTEDLRLDAAGADAGLVAALAAAPDPDLALAGLARLPHDPQLLAELRADVTLRTRLLAVLGTSAVLGDHLRRHPGDWRLMRGSGLTGAPSTAEVRGELLAAVGARLDQPGQPGPGPAPGQASHQTIPGPGGRGPGPGRARTPAAALAIAYRRCLLRLAARDLTGAVALDDVLAELADLAAAALEAALVIARSQLPPGAPPCRLAVIAMGKCGGRELNYASDVDVIFVAGPAAAGPEQADETGALRTATLLASAIIRVCSDAGPEGAIFPVDPNLRPEGRNGPLVRSLASHLAYYQRWAKTWEFQALLKARPVAGDAELGRDYAAALAPMVWQAAQREGFVADVQAMRRRVIASLPAGEAGRELKLGPGGLRDIEFAVQLLQLVHGRTDETLRGAATLDALAALAAGGYVGRQDAASLAAAYRFLRAVEHLLQLRQLRRTHTLPDDPAVLRQLGRALRSMRYLPGEPADLDGAVAGRGQDLAVPPGAGPAGAGADPAAELITRWRQHATVARQLHEKLFYRPLLDAVARLPGDVIRLTPEAAVHRLEALGYADPAGALRHIEALTSGVSRKAAIQRTLLPALLDWFADAPQPDPGLLAFRQVSEALGDSPWYLRLLRDDSNVAWRMARLLASGRYATGLLLRAPEAVAMLAYDDLLVPRPADRIRAEAEAMVRRHAGAADPVGPAAGLLALRRRELFRTATADLLGQLSLPQVGQAISTITAVTVAAALRMACGQVERSAGELPTRICVVAMGRFGGHEMGYASDADVLFVHDPLPGADEEAATRAAHAVAEELRRMLGRPGPDPPLPIDADLRPEGRQGPLVRTLAAYLAYYRRRAAPWEVQALLRAEPVAGDSGLCAAFGQLADDVRYPAGGMDEQAVREIRRIKARMEAERMPRGVDPALHVKLGPGGLADAEWVAQLLQLRHGGSVRALRTTQTLAALAAARDADLLDAGDATTLTESWLLAARIRNAVTLVRGRASDVVPTARPELAAVARLLGYPPDAAQDLVQDWRRAARRARAVMERVFYG